MLWCAGSSQTVTWARASRVLINIGLSAPYFINSSNNSWFQTDRQVDRGQGSGDQHMLTTTDQRWVQINTILHIRSEAITTAKQRKIGKTFLFSTHSYSPTLLPTRHVWLELDLLHFSFIFQVPIFNLIFGLLEILLELFMLMVQSCSRTTFFYPRLLGYTSKKF